MKRNRPAWPRRDAR